MQQRNIIEVNTGRNCSGIRGSPILVAGGASILVMTSCHELLLRGNSLGSRWHTLPYGLLFRRWCRLAAGPSKANVDPADSAAKLARRRWTSSLLQSWSDVFLCLSRYDSHLQRTDASRDTALAAPNWPQSHPFTAETERRCGLMRTQRGGHAHCLRHVRVCCTQWI